MVLPSGRRWYADASAAPIIGKEGQASGAVVVIVDVTQRKRNEEALRESEERFRALAELNPDAILVSCEGSYVYANPAAARLLGARSVQEVIGLTPFEIVAAPYHELVRRRMRLALEENREDSPLEYLWTRRDGSPVDVEVATGPINWQGQRAVQVVARDMTERKRAAEALRQADRHKDEFLAMLAHELRNPLAPISNAMHVLRKKDGPHLADKERNRALLAMMERQISHLVRLVDDLLDVSRISSGKILLRKAPTALTAILRDAVDASRPLMDAANHKLTIAFPPDTGLLVDADPVRLTQVFANLLNNAAKYTEAGGRIELKVGRKGEEAIISVRDNGVGIPAEMLPHLFKFFTQVDRNLSRSQGGLGIGLALARKLVQLHGGSIEANSEGPGRGSEFVVHLPLCKSAENEVMSEKDSSQELLAAHRVLVIDDDRDVADSLVLLLDTFGVTAQAAYSGAQGLEILAQFKPKLVFLDLGMPYMDGYETASRIRRHPEGRELTLVALSGWGQEGDRCRTEEAGFDDHLTKPADLEALEQLLTRLGAT